MRVKQTTLATAIALALATGGLTSVPAWADTSTQSIQTILDRTPAEDKTIHVTAGDIVNMTILGLNQTGQVDTRGEQLGSVIFATVETERGHLFVGSDTPGEEETNVNPIKGDYDDDLLPPAPDTPFNSLKYVRLGQGIGRAHVYYPPNINTPPIIAPPKQEDREYDECCFLPCGEKIPEGILNCPKDERSEEAVKLEPVEDTVRVTLQERFKNAQGGVEFKVIQTTEKKIKIYPYLPRVRKLDIVKFEAGPRDRTGTALPGESCSASDKTNQACDDNSNDGIRGKITAGYDGAQVTLWALRDALDSPTGFARDKAANGKVTLKLIPVKSRPPANKGVEAYMSIDAEMLNGEAKVTLPKGITKAGDYYFEAELYLAVNGAIDPTSDLALPKFIDNIDMFTADILTVKDTGKPAKLKLESTKKVISDDSIPPTGTPFNQGAAWNAATRVTVYVLDEYGNKTALPMGMASRVKVVDEAGVINPQTFNLDFAADPNRGWAKDWLGQDFGDIVKLGEASLVASMEGNTAIAASDPVKIKVVSKNLVARTYAGSNIAGDPAYGQSVPAANLPYPPPAAGTLPTNQRYDAATPNVVSTIRAGTQVRAFSVALDGGRINGIPNGYFDSYRSPVDGSVLPNLVDGANSDDDFVSRNSPATLMVKSPSGEEVEVTVAAPVFDTAGNVVEVVQADGTRGQGARIETLFNKPAWQFGTDANGNPDPNKPNYFIISDKGGNYGETIVYLPGDITPAAPAQGQLLNAHGYEPVALDKDGKPKLDENGNPIIELTPRLDHPNKDGTYQAVIPEGALKTVDAMGNGVTSGQSGKANIGSSNAEAKVISLDEHGNSLSLATTPSIPTSPELPTTRAADGKLDPGQPATGGSTDAMVLSYKSEEFAGTDRVEVGFTSPGVKPRVVEVVVPPKAKVAGIQTDIEQTTVPVNAVVAMTIRSLDQHGLPIDALGDTTVTFSGSILPTATIWRAEEEMLENPADPNSSWQPIYLLNSGDIIRPQGGAEQVLILDVGNKEGEFTLSFNNPQLTTTEPQKVTFKAVAGFGQTCSPQVPSMCKTETECKGIGGTWTDDKCEIVSSEQCMKEGGIYALDDCYLPDADGKPGRLDTMPGASTTDGGKYGDKDNENAGFAGGVLITSGPRSGQSFSKGLVGDKAVVLGDEVKIAGTIKVEEQDKGKRADIVVAGFHKYDAYPDGFAWYMMVECRGQDFVNEPTCPSYGWKIKFWPYDENGAPVFAYLEPLRANIVLPGTPNDGKAAYHQIDMFQGNFFYPAAEPMQIFFGYILTEGENAGKVVYTGDPIKVEIKISAGKSTPVKDDKKTDDTAKKDDKADDTAKKDDKADDTANKDDKADDTAKKDDKADDTAKKDDKADDTANKDDKADDTAKKDDKADATTDDNKTSK